MDKLRAWMREKCHPEWCVPALALALLVAAYALTSMGPSAGEGTSLEGRLEAVLRSLEGAGEVEVMIYRDGEGEDGAIRGAIVAAEGADQLSTRLALSQAMVTALDIHMDQVEIIPMSKEEAECRKQKRN